MEKGIKEGNLMKLNMLNILSDFGDGIVEAILGLMGAKNNCKKKHEG